MKRIASIALASVAATAGLAMVGEGSANADPGFCGVKVQGPTRAQGSPLWSYTIRNKCGTNQRFKINFPAVGRSSSCKTVYAGGYTSYSSIVIDDAWYIANC